VGEKERREGKQNKEKAHPKHAWHFTHITFFKSPNNPIRSVLPSSVVYSFISPMSG
jgi:hypothetical protein